MQHFVRQKNKDGSAVDWESFKVPVSRPAVVIKGTQALQTNIQSKTSEHRGFHSRASDVQQDGGQGFTGQGQVDLTHADGNDEVSGYNGYHANSDNWRPNNFSSMDERIELNEVQKRAMLAMDAGIARRYQGLQLPHIKGDTYPSTTSAAPSESDGENYFQGASDRQIEPKNLQRDETYDRRSIAAGQSSKAEHRGENLARNIDQSPRAPLIEGVSVKSKTPVVTLRTLAGAARQDDSRTTTSKQVELGYGREPWTNLSIKDSARVLAPGLRDAQKVAAPKVSLPFHQSREGEVPSMRRSRSFQATSSSDAESTHDGPVHIRNQDEQDEQQKQPHAPVELDYDPPVLYEMGYADLKDQPFDRDSHDHDLDLAESGNMSSLEARLSAFGSLESAAQATFFSDLTIDEWEEAGDWFLGQFGSLMRKMRQIRQQKRQAARSFESEIERREAAIQRKRKFTETFLNEMKENGGKVLQGTPKKGRML